LSHLLSLAVRQIERCGHPRLRNVPRHLNSLADFFANLAFDLLADCPIVHSAVMVARRTDGRLLTVDTDAAREGILPGGDWSSRVTSLSSGAATTFDPTNPLYFYGRPPKRLLVLPAVPSRANFSGPNRKTARLARLFSCMGHWVRDGQIALSMAPSPACQPRPAAQGGAVAPPLPPPPFPPRPPSAPPAPPHPPNRQSGVDRGQQNQHRLGDSDAPFVVPPRRSTISRRSPLTFSVTDENPFSILTCDSPSQTYCVSRRKRSVTLIHKQPRRRLRQVITFDELSPGCIPVASRTTIPKTCQRQRRRTPAKQRPVSFVIIPRRLLLCRSPSAFPQPLTGTLPIRLCAPLAHLRGLPP